MPKVLKNINVSVEFGTVALTFEFEGEEKALHIPLPLATARRLTAKMQEACELATGVPGDRMGVSDFARVVIQPPKEH